MAKRIKDTDYLAISARIRAMETGLLTRDRMEQILDARTDADALKIVQDSGYPDLRAMDPASLDGALSLAREATLTDLTAGAPDPRYIDVFKLKYDYHNVKAVLKAQAMGTEVDHMLMDMGRVETAALKEALYSGDLSELPDILAQAAEEAQAVLDTTRDPQLADIVLDRWYYRDMLDVAEATGSTFLQGYVRTQIDAANLRTLVRTLRMGKSPDFLADVLFEGGEVSTGAILEVSRSGGSGLAELYVPTPFAKAAELGADSVKGKGLTEFEKQCDNAVSDYLAGAQLVPFGEAPLVSYLAARETEYTNLRILLMGRGAGLDPDIIRSRLRETHV